MTAKVELNQAEALPLTFGVETKAENREAAKGGNYGVRIDLVLNDEIGPTLSAIVAVN